jgi:hypothetical protein
MLPLNLSLLGRDVVVEAVEELPGRYGEADSNINSIKIKTKQQALMEADTLLHECLHLISDYMQLNLTERQVYCTSVAFFALLRHNPELLDYFKYAIEHPREVV